MTRRERLLRLWNLGWDGEFGRMSVGCRPSAVNLPRLTVGADGEHGERESRWVSMSWGTSGADPVWHVDLDLDHTRVGRLLAETVWWFRDRWGS